MIRPCIVYADRCEEAINLYVSILPNSKVLSIQRTDEGKVLGATFELDGREFLAFDGGPTFKFAEGISMMVNCETQEEVDRYWSKLIEGGGEEGQCGWLKDQFGVSWQIVPNALMQMLSDGKSGNSAAALQAMLKMKKLDIAALKKAYASAA
ncbi:MAG: VOC family protein [Chloroflexi bacterium]|nr:MAG: VOC family protein [Chloroflexota bacterium]